jgi:hypothetical protein
MDGTVAYYEGPFGNLCINVSGGRSITLTHINSSITSGTVSAGQAVGTVAAPHDRNNNGVAHIHFQMWASSGCYSGTGIPFDSAHGARICGAPDLTASGPNGGNGTWSGTSFTGQECGTTTPSNYQPFSGDFNGDGMDDIGIRNVTTGVYYIRYSPDFATQTRYDWSPGTNYQPFSTDVNGDGLDDIGIRNMDTGVYYIRHSPSFANQTRYDWSIGDYYQPFGGDFNGDGIGDIGIRNILTGVYYMRFGPDFTSQTRYDWSIG